MGPIAPVVDGNTAKNADDPNTFSEANGDSFSLHDLIECNEDIPLSMDDINELLRGFSPSSPLDPSGSEDLPDSASDPDGSKVLPDSAAIPSAPYDTVSDVLTTDLTGLEQLLTQGARSRLQQPFVCG